MPDLNIDSPLVTLGALALAGQNDDWRKYTGGETGKGLVAGGFGGASAEWGGNQLQRVIGSDTVTDELAQAVVGGVVSEWGDMVPQNKAIARGIHYNVATQSMQDAGLAAGNLFGDITNGGNGGNGTTGGDTQSMQTEAMHNDAHSGGMVF